MEYKVVSDDDAKVEENDQLSGQNVLQKIVQLAKRQRERSIEIPGMR